MKEENFKILVKKLSGEINPAEENIFKNLLKSDKEFEKEYELMKKIWTDISLIDGEVDYQKLKQRTYGKINSIRKRRVVQMVYKTMQYAAIFAVLFFSIFFALSVKKTVKIANLSEAKKTVLLPDNSSVVLAKGSYLAYRSSLLKKFDRNIDFYGKAYFCISKDPEHKFQIHTNNFTVTVYGTKFDLDVSSKLNYIVLSEGKVRLNNFASAKDKKIFMKPGDIVSYNTDNGKIEKTKTNPKVYSFWTNDKFVFNNFTIDEIKEILKIYYGKVIVFDDTTLNRKEIGGSAPSDDLSLIIDALSIITEKKPQFSRDTIYFK